MWTTIIFVLIIILIIYWKGLNAAWIRLIIGFVAGSIIYVIFFMDGHIFSLTNLAGQLGLEFLSASYLRPLGRFQKLKRNNDLSLISIIIN